MLSKYRKIKLIKPILVDILPKFRYLCIPLLFVHNFLRYVGSIYQYVINEAKKSEFKSCGDCVLIHGSIKVRHPENLSIGDNVHINYGAIFSAEGSLSIGSNCQIGPNVSIYTNSHDYNGKRIPI